MADQHKEPPKNGDSDICVHSDEIIGQFGVKAPINGGNRRSSYQYGMGYPMDVMQPLTLKYRSGEEIKAGDQVLFHGNPAKIELVACDPNDPDPAVAWYMKEFGGGLLISDPKVSGRTFIRQSSLDGYEDLEFKSRATTGES